VNNDERNWSFTDYVSATGQNPRQISNQQAGIDTIRSVTIVNSTSATNVQFYDTLQYDIAGAGPKPDFVIAPGAAVTIPVVVHAGITLGYVAQAGKQLDGAVYVHLTNKTLSASGTAGGNSCVIAPPTGF
jgi:hypothetical protein